jgi:cyclophilin family peptidyl-prolyl cis-trans isomerase
MYFTVELFPVEKIPASVHTFLQQVHRGLWDGTSFYLNGKHVLMARPVSGNGMISRRKEFAKAGVEHVIFAEYHEDYPHEPYTLGFTGNPPGPSFYINKQDNTIPHGPGGKQHRKGEPCFGKIIIGTETIDRISRMKGTEKDPARIQPVDIVKVRILTDLREAVGGSKYLDDHANDQ